MISGLVSGHCAHSVGDCPTHLAGIGKVTFEVSCFNMHFHIVLPLVRKIIANTTAMFGSFIQHYESFKVPRLDELNA